MFYLDVFRACYVVGFLAFASPLTAVEVPENTGKSTVSGTHEQKVIELFEIMNLPAVYRREVDALVLKQQIQIQYFEYFEDVIRRWAIDVTGWEALRLKIAALYKDSFSEQELNDMLHFYRSPTGKKFLQLQPQLATKMRQIGTEAAQAHRDELRTMLRERAEELRKSGVIKNKADRTDLPETRNTKPEE